MARYDKTTATVIDGRIGTAISRSSGQTYYPIISYQYDVDGRIYTSDRYRQRPIYNTRRNPVEKTLDHHPPGSHVEIFYNVDNPSDSFVHKGFGAGITLLLVAIVLATLLFIAALTYITGALPVPF